MGSRRFLPWLLLAAGEAVFVGFLLLPDARTRLGEYLLLFSAGSLLSLLAARSLSASGPRFLLLCATTFRVTLLFRHPDLSEDIYRYLWDARVAEAGISPYAYVPADPLLKGIAPEIRSHLAHRDIRTVYPPVAQAAFRVGGGSHGGLFALKALFSAADLAIVLLLCRIGGGSNFAAALYAFHPLPVTETAGQGHVDSLGVVLLLFSLAYLARERRAAAGLAFAASVLTKYMPLAGFLPLARRGRLRFLLAFAVFAAALSLAAFREASPAKGLAEYATRWESNSLLYPALVRSIEGLDLPGRAKSAFIVLKEKLNHPSWTQEVFPFFYSAFFARAALGLLLGLSLLWILRSFQETEEAAFASLAALLLLSPALHPWYLLWVLPFAARLKEPAFLFLSSSVALSYALLYPLPGVSRGLVYAIEYVPFLLLLGVTLWRGRRAIRPPLPPGGARGVGGAAPRLLQSRPRPQAATSRSERPEARGEAVL